MTAMSSLSLSRSAAIYTFANVANSAIPFLLLPLLTRVLTPHEYGQVAVFSTLVTAFAGIVGLSAHGAINVQYFRSPANHARYVGAAFVLVGIATAGALALALFVAPWLTSWTGIPVAWLAFAVLAAAANALIQARLVMWQVRGEAVRYALFQTLQTGLNLLLSLLLVLAGLGWEGRSTGIGVASLLFAMIAVITLHRARLLEWRLDAADARDVLRFGVPLVPHVVGTLFIASSDRLIIARLTSVDEAGLYAAGLQIGLVIGMVADAIVKALGPWVYARIGSDDAAVRRRVVRVTYAYFAGIAAMALIFGVIAPHLLLVVGESFRSGPAVVLYVALGGAFGGMYLMVVNYIFYARRNELLSAASLSVGTLNIFASYWLVGHHGAVGAAQAYAMSQGLLFLVVWAVAAKICPMPWLDVFRLGRGRSHSMLET